MEWLDDALTPRVINGMEPIEKPEIVPTGPAELAAWLDREAMTATRFAGLVGVSFVTVYRWLGGEDRPTHENAAAIARATKGAVKVAAFFPEPIP